MQQKKKMTKKNLKLLNKILMTSQECGRKRSKFTLIVNLEVRMCRASSCTDWMLLRRNRS